MKIRDFSMVGTVGWSTPLNMVRNAIVIVFRVWKLVVFLRFWLRWESSACGMVRVVALQDGFATDKRNNYWYKWNVTLMITSEYVFRIRQGLNMHGWRNIRRIRVVRPDSGFRTRRLARKLKRGTRNKNNLRKTFKI